MKELYKIKKLENKIKSLLYGEEAKDSKDLIIMKYEPKSPKKKKKILKENK